MYKYHVNTYLPCAVYSMYKYHVNPFRIDINWPKLVRKLIDFQYFSKAFMGKSTHLM